MSALYYKLTGNKFALALYLQLIFILLEVLASQAIDLLLDTNLVAWTFMTGLLMVWLAKTCCLAGALVVTLQLLQRHQMKCIQEGTQSTTQRLQPSLT